MSPLQNIRKEVGAAEIVIYEVIYEVENFLHLNLRRLTT